MGYRGSGSLRLIVSVAAATILGTACGIFGNGTRPDAMSAEAHRHEADERAREAREHREQYDPEARIYLPTPYMGRNYYRYGWSGWDYYWDTRNYNPTAGHLAQAKKDERHAKGHLEAARVLENFEEGQCRSFPPETRVACPLLGHVEAVEDVLDGVRIRFDESIDMNAAIAHMRCHLAFARARARVGMDACPLYLPGIQIMRVGTSRSVDLSTSDREILEELRERTRAHLAIEPHG